MNESIRVFFILFWSRLMILFDFIGELRSDPYNMYSGNSDFQYGVRMDLRGVMVPLPDR